MSQIESRKLLEEYKQACIYPGVLNKIEVEKNLQAYLDALGVKRKIQRIEPGWEPEDYPSLLRYVKSVLKKIYPHTAQAAQAAQDAWAARTAQKRFIQWCVQAYGWWYWRFDLSWLVTTYHGAVQRKDTLVKRWSKPLYRAFLSGAWILHWTEDTLFWVAKPKVHFEKNSGRRLLHNETGPALESDVQNLYFWKGVLVPAFVVVKPQWITVEHIETETNAEVRRVMIERYGQSKYLIDSGAKEIHKDDWGTLYRKEIPNDEPLVMVKVVNSTPEPNGEFKDYFLRIQPELRPMLKSGLGDAQELTGLNTVASTFGMTGKQYKSAMAMQS